MFILDTDHISLFPRRDPHVTARVLATPALELATTVITVEEQVRGRLDRVRRAHSGTKVVRAYRRLLDHLGIPILRRSSRPHGTREKYRGDWA